MCIRDSYSYIDEAAADDADYLYTQTQGAGLEIKLGSVLDPLASTGHVVRFRYYVAGSSTAERQTVLLLQGATTRATVVNNATVTRNAWTQVDYTLTAGQADPINDYSDLRPAPYHKPPAPQTVLELASPPLLEQKKARKEYVKQCI